MKESWVAPEDRKPHLTVRTKYIGQRTGTLLGEFDIWDVQAKYVASKTLKKLRA